MRKLKELVILGVLGLLLLGCQQKKAKVLIIGDSISIGYTPYVQKNLQQLAEVVHNPGNAQHTGTGIDKVEAWIGDQEWDIIQFNWGLWDLCYRHKDSKVQGNRDKIHGEITFDVEAYGSNLDAIVTLIKNKSKAKLIFVTTSYVPDKEAGRFQEDAIRYNKMAKMIMESKGVTINDIYPKSELIHHQFGKQKGDVHYLPRGYEALGLHISDFLVHEINKL